MRVTGDVGSAPGAGRPASDMKLIVKWYQGWQLCGNIFDDKVITRNTYQQQRGKLKKTKVIVAKNSGGDEITSIANTSVYTLRQE